MLSLPSKQLEELEVAGSRTRSGRSARIFTLLRLIDDWETAPDTNRIMNTPVAAIFMEGSLPGSRSERDNFLMLLVSGVVGACSRWKSSSFPFWNFALSRTLARMREHCNASCKQKK